MDEKYSWLDGISAVTLKSLLENPNMLMPMNMMRAKNGGDDYNYQEKQKNVERTDDYGNPMSAFLGPKLWENTLPDNNDLKFEYMDIEEFLSEHGLSSEHEDSATKRGDASVQTPSQPLASTSPPQPLTSLPTTQPLARSQNTQPMTPVARENLCSSKQEDVPAVTLQNSCSHNLRTAEGPEVKPMLPPSQQSQSQVSSSPSPVVQESASVVSSPPREPSPVKIDIPFEVSSTDVALATVPGETVFNPREKKFSEEELKPQPMIKKSRKVFVPDEQKDDKYWERRRKNNVAAKRSRDARRVKENQIVLRASFLERENSALKGEVLGLKKDNMSLKKVVANLEKQLRAMQDGKLK